MKSQILFSGENKKNIIRLSSAELAQRVVKIYGIKKKKKWSFGHYAENEDNDQPAQLTGKFVVQLNNNHGFL